VKNKSSQRKVVEDHNRSGLGSNPTKTHISRWWDQEGHMAKHISLL